MNKIDNWNKLDNYEYYALLFLTITGFCEIVIFIVNFVMNDGEKSVWQQIMTLLME